MYMYITALSWPRGFRNSMMLLDMLFRATQDGWIIVKNCDECGPLEERMTNHSIIIVHGENPMNSI